MTTWLDRTLAALRVDPLSFARSSAASGQRVIAYVGPDVPVELLLAADALPVRLRGMAGAATPNADAFIESRFLPETRSIAEQWVSGALTFADSIVFPRSDDSAQRLYYYLCELQRNGASTGPTPRILDIASISRTSSAQHTAATTAKLARELGASESAMPRAIEEVREHTRALHRVSELQNSGLLTGSSAITIASALNACWNAQFRRDISEYLAGVVPSSPPRRRVLYVGNSPPDDRLHLAVERSGASIVRELTNGDWFANQNSTGLSAETFEALGLRAHARVSLANQLARSSDVILETAREARVDGVLIWSIEEDSTLGWELPGQLRTLEQAGLPTLALTRQQWVAPTDTLDAIDRFCAGLVEFQ